MANGNQFDSVISGSGLQPLKLPAPALPSVPAPPVDEFAGFEEVKPAPVVDEFAAFESADEFAGFDEADTVDFSTPEELLADKDFNIVQFVKMNPEVLDDPARSAKIIEAYRQQRIEGITSAVVGQAIEAAPAVGGEFLKGARDLTERLIDAGLQPAVNGLLGMFSDPQTRRELIKETKRVQTKAVAEISAGSETAAFGLSNLFRTGKRKVATSDDELRSASESDLRADLLDDVSFAGQAEEVAKGQGVIAETTGLDAAELAKEGIILDPAAIESISFVDPLTLVGTGGVLKLVAAGGKVIATVKTVQQAGRLAAKLGTTVAKAGAATGAAVAKVAPKVAGAVPKGVGKAIAATGRFIEQRGVKNQGVLKFAGGVAGAVKGGSIGGPAGALAGATIGASGGKTLAKGIEALGRFGQRVGEGTTRLGGKIAGEIPKGRLFNAVIAGGRLAGKVAKSPPVVGATIGAVAAVPLGLAADTDEEAAQLIAGGIALGGGAGLAVGGIKGIVGLRERVVGRRLLDPKEAPKGTLRESADYGSDAALDQGHREAFAAMDPDAQIAVNEFRELFRNEGEVYVQSPEQYAQRLAEIAELEKGAPLTAEELAQVQSFSDTHAVFSKEFQTPEGPKKVVFLNKDSQGLTHDSGHLLEALLPEAERVALQEQVNKLYSRQEIDAFRKVYEDALNQDVPAGEPRRTLTDEGLLGEIIAENFSALMANVDVATLGTPRPLVDRMVQSVASVAERAGIDLSGGRQTPNLPVRPSIGLQRMLENAARRRTSQPEAVPAPEGPRVDFGTPEALAPDAVANKRVTPAEQAGTAAAAPDTAGITEARAFAAQKGDAALTKVVDDIAASFERKRGEVTPLELEVLGAKETAPGKKTTRRERKAEQAVADAAEVAGALPEDVRKLFQAVHVPISFSRRGANLMLNGMSLDKVLANSAQIAKQVTKNGLEKLSPYDVVDGAFTPEAWRILQKDLAAYAENQQNGFRGDGKKLIRPDESLGAQLPAENPSFNPTALPDNVGQFLNMLMGEGPPLTAKKGNVAGVPGNIKARTIAELNLREVEVPVRRLTKAQAEKQTFPTGEVIGEVNPLRNEFARQGLDIGDLHEVIEILRVDRIKKVTPRSELQFRAPKLDTFRAGFLPKKPADLVAEVSRLGGEDFKKAMDSQEGGLTGSAVQLGKKFNSPEQVEILRTLEQTAKDDMKTALRAGNMDEAMLLASKPQFFREARESATSTGSIGAAEARGDFSNFLPKTATGKELVKGGFKVRQSNDSFPGTRHLKIEKNGETVGEIVTHQVDLDTASVDSVLVDPDFRGQLLGEALYRELGAQLQEDGVTKLTGGVISDLPLRIRERVFGDFESIVNAFGEPEPVAVLKGRLGEARRANERGDSSIIERVTPVNRIDPNAQFQPRTEAGKAVAKEFEFARGIGISEQEKTIGIFLKDGSAEIGQVIYELDPGNNVANILSLTVEPEFQRKGIGSALVREAFADAQDAGFAEIGSLPGIVDERAVGVREKIAPGRTKFTAFDGTEFTPDQARTALKAKDRFEQGGDAIVDAQTRLEGAQFLPRKKTEKALPLPPKAFIGPDGSFIKVNDATHDAFLIGNAEKFNKKFGTKIPKKQGKADVRIGALNKGFVRIAYERNNGQLTYEANIKRFGKAQQDKIFEHVVDNLDNIDNLTVSLLDDKGNVKKTASRRFFQMEDDVKMDSIPFVTDEGLPQSQRSFFLPKDTLKDKGFASEVERIAKGEKDGETFNVDGTVFKPGDQKLDVVTVASRDIPVKDLNPDTIKAALEPFSQLLENENVKPGLFKIERKTVDGQDLVSVDVNAMVPQEFRENSKAFAKANNQESIFDLAEFETIETGGDGQTVLTDPVQMAAAVEKIVKGEPVEFPAPKDVPDNSTTLPDPVAAPDFATAATLPKKRKAGELDFGLDTRVPTERRKLGKKERSMLNRKQLREQFPEAVIPRIGDTIPYDITKSPLFKKFRREDAQINAFADRLVEKYKPHANDKEVQFGLRWYDDFTPLLKARYGKDAPVMAELLSATSPNTTPRVNFGFAEAAYKRWKAGDFDGLISKFEEGLGKLGDGSLEKAYKAEVPKAEQPKKTSEATYMGWWIKKHDLIPRQVERITKKGTISPKFGMHSEAVLKVVTRRWLNKNRGLKTNNFVRNLLGTSEEATIDLWAARTMREAGFEGLKDRWRILPENAQAVTDADFVFSQKVFKEAAKRLGIKAHQLQGAMWFLEKKQWADRGWVELDLGDYRTEINRVAEAEKSVVPDPQSDLFQ